MCHERWRGLLFTRLRGPLRAHSRVEADGSGALVCYLPGRQGARERSISRPLPPTSTAGRAGRATLFSQQLNDE